MNATPSATCYFSFLRFPFLTWFFRCCCWCHATDTVLDFSYLFLSVYVVSSLSFSLACFVLVLL
jgi:hypothetical protein